MRDVANNYTMNCSWGPRKGGVLFVMWHYGRCTPADDPDVDPFLWRFQIMIDTEWRPDKQLGISQIWVCDPKNGSYPFVTSRSLIPSLIFFSFLSDRSCRIMYESEASTPLTATCPESGDRDTTYSCNITSKQPIILETSWYPAVHSKSLEPHPTPERPIPSTQMPSKDCTAASFAAPAWVIEHFNFTRMINRSDRLGAKDLNFTLTNRATDIRLFCVPATNQPAGSDGSTVNLNCTRELAELAEDPYNSNSTLKLINFMPFSRQISIIQTWRCGNSASGEWYLVRPTNLSPSTTSTIKSRPLG
jgi:hypothetical protein